MTGTMRNKPAACCCDSICKIDSFTSETAFTEDAIRPTEHPQSPYPAWLQSEVKAAVGDTLKLFLAWDESDPGDGLYVEFTPADGATNGTLKLYRKDGTQLGTTLQLLCADETYWHLITACYDPDTDEFTACFDARDSRGYVVRGQCVSATVPTGFEVGRKAGYGGTGSIKNYRHDRLWYIGEGTEQPCCVPEITETQAGMLPNTPPFATVTGGSDCYGNLTLTFRGPYPQDGEEADATVYMPPSPFDLDGFLGQINNQAAINGWDVTYSATYVDGVLTITCTPGESIAFDDIVSNWVSDSTGCDVTLTLNPGSEAGQNAKQSVTLPESPCPFILSFDGETTAGLTETSTAAEVQAALEALSTIGDGNVTVTGSAGGPFVVEFVGTLGLQPVASLTGSSNDETCLDCDGDYYGYYADECPRTVCHRCGSPSCTVVSETFAGIEGTEEEPGDMPCGWDADATDWGVVDGKATGNGAIYHKYDLVDDGYILTATFVIGELATDGDAVTVALLGDGKTLSATITRIASDEYTIAYNQGLGSITVTEQPLTLTLLACPDTIYGGSLQWKKYAMIGSPIGVNITQPTLLGHSDSSLESFSLTRHAKAREDCPVCPEWISCGICEFPDYMSVDLGPPFLTSKYGCEECAKVEGVFGLELYNACQWIYAPGTSCACGDPSCGGPTKVLSWSLFLQAFVSFGTVLWTLTLNFGRIVDPGDTCLCQGVYGVWAGTTTGCGFPASGILELTRSILTVDYPNVPGAECYGTIPPTVRIAFDGGVL